MCNITAEEQYLNNLMTLYSTSIKAGNLYQMLVTSSAYYFGFYYGALIKISNAGSFEWGKDFGDEIFAFDKSNDESYLLVTVKSPNSSIVMVSSVNGTALLIK